MEELESDLELKEQIKVGTNTRDQLQWGHALQFGGCQGKEKYSGLGPLRRRSTGRNTTRPGKADDVQQLRNDQFLLALLLFSSFSETFPMLMRPLGFCTIFWS